VTYLFLSLLINCSLALAVLALALLLMTLALGQLRKVAYLSAVDLIELRSRWQQSGLDLQNQALSLSHRSKMLGIEVDQAVMGLREKRQALLACLESEVSSEVS
jgi:hypothetical protein